MVKDISKELSTINSGDIDNEKALELQKKIDVSNISDFGNDAQKGLVSIADGILNKVKTGSSNRLGGVSDQLVALTTTIHDSNEPKPKNLLQRIFRKGERSAYELSQKTDTVANTINKLRDMLVDSQDALKRDNASMENMFNQAIQSYKDTQIYIDALKLEYNDVISKKLPAAQKALEKSAPEDQMAANNKVRQLTTYRDLLSKRIANLSSSQSVAQLSIVKLNTMAYGNISLIEDVNTAINTLIPIWKIEATSRVYAADQEMVAKAADAMKEQTKKAITEGAKAVAEQGMAIAQENQKSAIDSETMNTAYTTMSDGINKIRQIVKEGDAQRRKDIKASEEIIKKYSKLISDINEDGKPQLYAK